MIDLDGFENYLYEEELAKNTIDVYLLGAKQYSKLYDDISKKNIIEWKKMLSEKCKPQTVNLRITAIMKYCKYKDIPMKVKHIKEQRKTHIDNVITAEQFERLITGLKTDGNMRGYYHVMLLAKTGMRVSEAVRVTKKDVLNEKVTMQAKAHMRTIYFPKSLRDDIAPLLDNMNDDDIVIQNRFGQPMTTRGIAENLIRYAKRYDIPQKNMHPHAFRHFFAIEFLKRNNNIALLADLLGHGSVNVTQIYLRQSQEEQKRAIDEAVNW